MNEKEDNNGEIIITRLDLKILKQLVGGSKLKWELHELTNSANQHIKKSLEHLQDLGLIRTQNKQQNPNCCGGHKSFIIKGEERFVRQLCDHLFKE